MSSRLQDELQELAEYRASGLTPEEVIRLAREREQLKQYIKQLKAEGKKK